jgi:hypothetical protein
MYTKEELGFILYNNRSVTGVVNNFIDNKTNPFDIIRIENLLKESKSLFQHDSQMVEIDINQLHTKENDVLVTKEDLENLTQLFQDNIGTFNPVEYDYLMSRGIGEKKIIRYDLLGLSSITDNRHLEIIGASCHPILKGIFDDGIGRGGIIIPLYESGKLKNCAIRRLDSSKALKYSLSCPDIPVWGLDWCKPGCEVWICEGLFDMIALHSLGKPAVSCSSAMWSSIQLNKVLKIKPSVINIFSDNDSVGLRTSGILKDFFQKFDIPTKVFKSLKAKDPAEHFLQKENKLTDIVEIFPKPEDLIKSDESFNFIEYLKNRKF